MTDGYLLLAAGSVSLQRFHLCCKGPCQFIKGTHARAKCGQWQGVSVKIFKLFLSHGIKKNPANPKEDFRNEQGLITALKLAGKDTGISSGTHQNLKADDTGGDVGGGSFTRGYADQNHGTAGCYISVGVGIPYE